MGGLPRHEIILSILWRVRYSSRSTMFGQAQRIDHPSFGSRSVVKSDRHYRAPNDATSLLIGLNCPSAFSRPDVVGAKLRFFRDVEILFRTRNEERRKPAPPPKQDRHRCDQQKEFHSPSTADGKESTGCHESPIQSIARISIVCWILILYEPSLVGPCGITSN